MATRSTTTITISKEVHLALVERQTAALRQGKRVTLDAILRALLKIKPEEKGKA
jgi:hypothetical protein